MEAETQPWERLPNETLKQWAAFQAYRDLPPERRSVRAGFEAQEAQAGRTVRATSRPPRRWQEWSAQNAWTTRAAAWDREQDRAARAVAIRNAAKAKQKRLEEAAWMHEAGVAQLRAHRDGGDAIPPAVAVQMVKVGQDAERLELGEATSRTEAEIAAVPAEVAAERQAQVDALLRVLFPGAEDGAAVETGAPVQDG